VWQDRAFDPELQPRRKSPSHKPAEGWGVRKRTLVPVAEIIVTFERPCITDGCVYRRSRTSGTLTPRALPTAPPRSELGFNLARRIALDVGASFATDR